MKLPYVALERYTDRRLAEMGFGDVRPAHYAVFQVLNPQGSRLTELAGRAGMTKQSMGYLVDYLEKHGYLQRVRDPLDQRAQIIRVTPKARKLDEAVERAIDELHDAWAARMGKARVRQLRTLLGDLVNVLPDPATAAPKKEGSPLRPPSTSAQDRI